MFKLWGLNTWIKKHAFKFTTAGIEVFPKLKMGEVVSISDKKVNFHFGQWFCTLRIDIWIPLRICQRARVDIGSFMLLLYFFKMFW